MNENGKLYTVNELLEELKSHDGSEKVTVFFHNNISGRGYGTTQTMVYGARNFTLFFNSVGYVKDGEAKQLDIAPFVKDGQGYASLYTIEDIFNINITHIPMKNIIIINNSGVLIIFELNSNLVLLDGITEKRIKGMPILKEEKVFLPLEYIFELLEMEFEYILAADGSIAAITIF
ncbi:MAG: stalk domain-containing protein [Bacillota bacterium]